MNRNLLATATVVVLALGSASVLAAPPSTATAQVEHPRPQEPSSGVTGEIRLAEADGALTITGTARGLNPGTFYISLVYDKGSSDKGPDACEPTFPERHPHNIEATMFVGIWVVDPSGNGLLLAGPNATPLGLVGAVSIRDTSINGGFGPEAVVACGRVVPTPVEDL